MSRSLVLSFQSASAKYSRLHKKIKKSVARGEFFRFTRRKRNHLLARIEKLRKRLVELRTQIRLASAGIAAAALFGATSAQAQASEQFGTKVGPFIQNELKNPLPAPPFIANQLSPFTALQYTEVQYHDFDKDGDLNAILTFGYRTRIYYENIGTTTQAKWEERLIGDVFQASLPGPDYNDNAAHQTYADLDDDGDLDAIAAVYQTQTNPSPDNIFFMENTPAANGDPYFLAPTSDLFPSIIVNGAGWPVLADVDGDGDSDLILAGRYFDVNGDQNAFIQYFRNDKVGHTPGELPTFTPITGEVDNPFYLQDLGYKYVSVNFADLDEDGDQDFIYTAGDGSTLNTYYRKNSGGGIFTDQVGAWNATNGTGNPLSTMVSAAAPTNGYISLTFGDLDGDGDDDLTIGLAHPMNTSLEAVYPFRYAENKGKGVFEFSQENQIYGHSFGNYLTSTMFDHDGDGDLDLITVATTFVGVGCEGSSCGQQYYVSQRVFLNENGELATHYTEIAMPDDFPTIGSNFVQLIDVEGDGDLDIISNFDFDGSRALMYWRNDNGEYTQLEGADNPFDFANDPEYPFAIPSMADLNNDGLIDLILTPSYPGASAYKNIGTKAAPVFEFEENWSEGLINSPAYDNNIPSLVDMDGDGDYDLIVSKYGDVWYYQNQGTKEEPVFAFYSNGQTDKDGQPASIEQWGENPFAFFDERMGYFNLSDFDGDGDKDLLFGESLRGIFKLYENQNPAPTVLVKSNAPTSFTLNQPVTLITDVSIKDPDKDNIVKVVATVTPFKPGADKLELIGNFGSGITANWVDTTGTLTITGLDSTKVIGVLKGIQYTYVASGSTSGRTSKEQGKNGTQQTVNRAIEIVTYDADLTKEAPNTQTFNLSGDDGGNQAPIIIAPRKTAASGGNIAFYISQIAEDLDGEIDLQSAIVTSDKGDVVFGSDHDLVTIDYSKDKTYQGTDDIFVSVCDNLGACASSNFTVDIKADIVIFTGMSPNNDQVNDWFHIDYLPEGTHVAIYNRWGDLIYEESNYNVDDPARRFEGKNKNGTEVIAGTYYYKVKYPGGSTKSGYILLNR